MEEFIYEDRYQYLISAMLNVTDDCNLTCKYCFVEQNPHYMTLDVAKAAADFLYKNYEKRISLGYLDKDPDALCQLYFFGGEPMLCFKSIIVPTVEYCNEKYPGKFHFGMTTNGTLLSKESIDFLKANNFGLLLSMDGNKDAQNFNRPCKNTSLNSFDLIEKNIPYLLKEFPKITFRTTVYAPSVDQLFQGYLYAESKGFKSFQMMEDNRNPWTQEQLNQLSLEFSKIYTYRLQQIINGITPMDFPRFQTWLKIAAKLYKEGAISFDPNFVNTVYRCGLATTNGAIGWDGSIYGCQEQVSHGKDSHFYIGNIFSNGIDIDKHKKLLSEYTISQHKQIIKKPECNNCVLNQLCKDNFLGCPSTSVDLFNEMDKITEVGCYMRQLYYINSILFLDLLLTSDNDKIKEYINLNLHIVRNGHYKKEKK